ncbi:hypothetical protein KQI52_13130 [bacterium]|nr:hypothetical protein [bacterium]
MAGERKKTSFLGRVMGLFRRGKLRCPICRSTNIRRSTRKGWLETDALPWIHAYPYRCRDCSNRFFLHVRQHRDAISKTRFADASDLLRADPENKDE